MIALAAVAAEGVAELAKELGELGPVVVLAPERPPDLSGEVAFVPVDLGSPDAAADGWRSAEETHGPAESLVTLPGPAPTGPVPVTDVGDALWSSTLRDNLLAAMHAARAAARAMTGRGHGRIVMVTWQLEDAVGFVPLAAACGSVRHLARTLASEVGEQGVTVNAVSVARGRLFDAAPAVRLLCSPDGGYLTSEALRSAGGGP